MPEKVFLEDGTEREVPTEDELRDLRAGHDANLSKKEQLSKLRETLGLKDDDDDIVERIAELKEDVSISNVDNVRKMRNIIKAQKAILKEKGANVDDDGNIIAGQANLTSEQVLELSNKTFDQRQLEANKLAVLSKFTPEDAKSIGSVFDKIHALGGSFEENMNLAISKILPNESKSSLNSIITASGGGAPRIATSGKGGVSNELKQFAGQAFGLTEADFNLLNK